MNQEDSLENQKMDSEPIRQRIKYIPPGISVINLEMESSLAASSATIRPVGSNEETTLDVKSWMDVDKGNYEIDL